MGLTKALAHRDLAQVNLFPTSGFQQLDYCPRVLMNQLQLIALKIHVFYMPGQPPDTPLEQFPVASGVLNLDAGITQIADTNFF
jgi:hypothetical protein